MADGICFGSIDRGVTQAANLIIGELLSLEGVALMAATISLKTYLQMPVQVTMIKFGVAANGFWARVVNHHGVLVKHVLVKHIALEVVPLACVHIHGDPSTRTDDHNDWRILVESVFARMYDTGHKIYPAFVSCWVDVSRRIHLVNIGQENTGYPNGLRMNTHEGTEIFFESVCENDRHSFVMADHHLDIFLLSESEFGHDDLVMVGVVLIDLAVFLICLATGDEKTLEVMGHSPHDLCKLGYNSHLSLVHRLVEPLSFGLRLPLQLPAVACRALVVLYSP